MKLAPSLILLFANASAFQMTHTVTTTPPPRIINETPFSNSRLYGLADDELESAIQRSVREEAFLFSSEGNFQTLRAFSSHTFYHIANIYIYILPNRRNTFPEEPIQPLPNDSLISKESKSVPSERHLQTLPKSWDRPSMLSTKT